MDFEILYEVSLLIPLFHELKTAILNQDLDGTRASIQSINPILSNLLNLVEGDPHYSAIYLHIRRIMDGMEVLHQLGVANPNLRGDILYGCYYDIVAQIIYSLSQITVALTTDPDSPVGVSTLVFNQGARWLIRFSFLLALGVIANAIYGVDINTVYQYGKRF